MVGGSQLSQLKSTLSNAGFTRQSTSKKRKRTEYKKTDKDKRFQRLQEIHEKLNPFDVKVTKLKHTVAGRKLKGVIGKPSISKQVAIEQRKKTLLKEYEGRKHVGGIIDRRFGENDPTLTVEERMLGRFTKERQRSSKGASFNLEDEEELTHYGRNLSKFDDFENININLDLEAEESDGKIDEVTVSKAHFGGFGVEEGDPEEPPRKKSKAEVMAEVIAKSKEYKYQRQMERQQDANVRHELDENFQDIRSLLVHGIGTNTSETQSSPEKEITETRPVIDWLNPRTETDQFSYDQHVRELALDKRAKPKDRTKTEEELASEAKEALETAEKERLKRMMVEVASKDSDLEEGHRKVNSRRHGGDDIEDDFESHNDRELLGFGLVGIYQDANNDASKVDKTDTDADTDVSASSQLHSEDDIQIESHHRKQESREFLYAQRKEIPYTFPCPQTHDELLEVLKGIPDNDISVALKRIRTLHHSSLAEGNKGKLENLTEVLIDHLLYISSPPTPDFMLVKLLIPHIKEMSQAYPTTAACHFVSKLKLMQKNFFVGLSKGASCIKSKTWPGTAELSFLRIISIIWPTSDTSHYVVTPARILMASFLGLGNIRNIQDIASGMYICTLILRFERLSKRFYPETITFLINSILYLAPHEFGDDRKLSAFPCPNFNFVLHDLFQVNTKTSNVSFEYRKPKLLELLSQHSNKVEQNKFILLRTCFQLAARFSEFYKGFDGFFELFEPVQMVLKGVVTKNLPSTLQSELEAVLNSLGRLLQFSQQLRPPLLLQAHKPIPIASYIPKFETTSSYFRRSDPDQERSAMSKLRSQYKNERKGAMRELRKDSKFLANVHQEEQQEKDRRYRESMNRTFSSLEMERAEQKKTEREKLKERKRAR